MTTICQYLPTPALRHEWDGHNNNTPIDIDLKKNEYSIISRKDLVEGGSETLTPRCRRRRHFNNANILSSIIVTALLLLLFAPSSTTTAFLNPIDVISRDFQALTRKVTAHHILLPKSADVALKLKQTIRDKASPKSSDDPKYIVDVFASAAKKYSRDEETAVRGGLLGKLVPQGYCRAKELDAACFEVPLGEVAGPIESEYGYHLLLVTERTNCPKLDGRENRIECDVEDGFSTKFVPGDSSQEGSEQVKNVALQQVGFWMGVSLAGGVMAEVAAKTANVIDTLPWE